VQYAITSLLKKGSRPKFHDNQIIQLLEKHQFNSINKAAHFSILKNPLVFEEDEIMMNYQLLSVFFGHLNLFYA